MNKRAKKSKLQGVLIVLAGGVADIRYVPPGVQVFIKDYDIESSCELDEKTAKCTEENHRVDKNGDEYHLIASSFMSDKDKAAKKEAERLAQEEL